MASTTMKALVIPNKTETAVKDVPIPQLGPKDILVKTKAVALNPTDWKHVDFLAEQGAISGCDFTGIVDKVGSDVSAVKKGDRVAGIVHGGRVLGHNSGAFAEYVKTEGTLVWKVPENVNDEEAAALAGVGTHTAVQVLYFRLGLNHPSKPTTTAEPILVWSGATSVGLYAIQLLKLSGYTVVTTSSPSNFELLKSLGADDVYSYADPETPSKISHKYPNLSKAVDTITEKKTLEDTLASLGKDVKDSDKHVRLLLGTPADVKIPDGAKVESSLAYSLAGKPFDMMGEHNPAIPEDVVGIEAWCQYIPALVESGKLKSNPIKSMPGGLEGIKDGLAYMKAGKNRGQKLTYKI